MAPRSRVTGSATRTNTPFAGDTSKRLAEILVDPVKYAQAILGYDLWETPQAILRAMAEPNARVAVRSCHASGKSHLTGAIEVPWFMTRYSDGIAATTAPTWTQVRDVIWKEIHTSLSRSRIELPPANNTEWRFEDKNHYAIGLSTTEAEKFSGFHAPRVLIAIDEAPGVKEDIWEGIDGIRAGGDVRVLALGNPTISAGPFFKAFGSNRSSWTTFTIDGFATPNLQTVPGDSPDEKLETLLNWEKRGDPRLGISPRPYLITRRWIVERFHEWGIDSPLWTARVRGRFPTQSSESLIALGWAEGIAKVKAKMGIHSLGCDVARYGNDSTAFTKLHGNEIARMWKVQGRSVVDTANEITRLHEEDPLMVIVIDDTGVGGGVTDILRDKGIAVVAFNGGEVPRYNDDVLNRLSEAYWSLSLALRDGDIAIAEDISPQIREELTEQLVGIEYKFNGKQKIQVYKKGLKEDHPSPDLADSLNMAWEAHRLEVSAPNLTSAQIDPIGADGYSSRDRPGLWSGWGAGRLSAGSGNALGTGTLAVVDLRDPDANPQYVADRIGTLCPSCGLMGVLVEKGKSGGMRIYQFTCPNPTCGHSQVMRQKEDRPGRSQ